MNSCSVRIRYSCSQKTEFCKIKNKILLLIKYKDFRPPAELSELQEW